MGEVETVWLQDWDRSSMHRRFDLRTGRCLESKLEATSASWIPHFGVFSRCNLGFALAYRTTDGVWFQFGSRRFRMDCREAFFFHSRKLGGAYSVLRIEPQDAGFPVLTVRRISFGGVLFTLMSSAFEQEFFSWIAENANDPGWRTALSQAWQPVDSSEPLVLPPRRVRSKFLSRLHDLLTMLLNHQISAEEFCVDFKKIYHLELDADTLSCEEKVVFAQLLETVAWYVPFVDERKSSLHHVSEGDVIRAVKRAKWTLDVFRQTSDWSGPPMSSQQLQEAGWDFKVENIATGVSRVRGTDRLGRNVEATGTNLDALFDRCRYEASRILAECDTQK